MTESSSKSKYYLKTSNTQWPHLRTVPFRKPTKNAGQITLISPVFQQNSNWKSGKTMWPSSPVQLWCSFYWAQDWLQVATQRAKPRVHKCHGWQLALQKNNLKMQVEEISFSSPFSRTSVEKKLSVHLMCLVCLHQLRTHLRKHEQKNCCIRSLSKSSVLTVTWCSGKNPTKLDLQRLQHIRLSLSSHTSSRAKSHTIIPSIKMKCWDKEV